MRRLGLRAGSLVAAVLAAGLASQPVAAAPRVALDAADPARLVLTAPGYRLVVGKKNGAILELVDRTTGGRVVAGSSGCLWGALPTIGGGFGGCGYSPRGARRFAYAWSGRGATLTLRYGDEATATLVAGDSSFDLRLSLVNRRAAVLEAVQFPADLVGAVRTVEAGYAPTYLPGIRLRPSFFSRVGDNLFTYPSRWAFADYLALDAGGGRLAVSGVNPAPSPLAPVELGFLHREYGACSGRIFCLRHAYQTWVQPGARWTSPLVRVRVGASAEASMLGYRRDNGIDRYPSLADKLGARLDTLARAPLVKADLWKGLHPFAEWAPDLRRLPSPSLVHPVAFQDRGHDESYPDFLPPDRLWGTDADFRGMIDAAHGLGSLVMPYLNVSWWDDESPTLRSLPDPAALAVLGERGRPVAETYDLKRGLLVSPYVPAVRDRVAALMEQWRSEVPVDCTFFDQIGARPWLRDYNPASPTPLAYDDGWLSLFAPYAGRCLMVEDGWDRLAQSFSGFHGGGLLMARQFDEPDRFWGAGNWQPYPLALWLLHDKVLLYQHDLYEPTTAMDDEVVAWDMAFGLVLSYAWDAWNATLDSPWLDVTGALQRALGPRYAGKPLASFREPAAGVTESVFGDLTVTATWGRPYRLDGYGLGEHGFLARSDGVLAGAFTGVFGGAALSPGTHYVVVEREGAGLVVRHPLGADTTLALEPPSAGPLRAVAYAANGVELGTGEGELRGGRYELQVRGKVAGQKVAYYRIG